MKAIPIAFAILVVLSANSLQGIGVRVGPNIDIRGEGIPDQQVTEPSIAVDPRNPNILVAGAQDRRLVPPNGCFSAGGCHLWSAYYRSTDGGVTWTSRLLPGFSGDTSQEGSNSPLRHFTGSATDQVAFDRSGNVYYSGVVANHTSSGDVIGKSHRVFVAKFVNDGADFVKANVLTARSPGFPRMAVDTSGGPNDGNVYLTFLLTGQVETGVFTRSIDGGLTFSKPIQIPGAGLPLWITVDPAGNVFVVSEHCTGNSLHCTSGASATLLVAKSTDGGLTFGKSVVAARIKPLPTPLPGNGFDSLTSPQITADLNGIYVVWDDFRTGDANVMFTESTDGGSTWNNPIIVNDSTQRQQFFPTIAASGGIINVAWYDSRLGQLPNGRITSLDVFYTESRDAGSSFSRSVRVTSASFDPNLVLTSDPNPGSPGSFSPNLGGYISIAASPTSVHPIWTDNRNACDTVDPAYGCVDQDAYTATITP